MTQIFSGYIDSLFNHAATNIEANWRAKDAAIFLVTALSVRGTVQGKGATSTNASLSIQSIFVSHILPDLQAAAGQPVLKAAAIKFLMTFRGQLVSREGGQHLQLLPLLGPHLGSSSLVVVSYAASCVEKCMSLKAPPDAAGNQSALFTDVEVARFAESLLTNLFQLLSRSDCKDNEYVMKAIMRTLAGGKASLASFAPTVLDALAAKMTLVAENPGNARFIHFLFESIACAIKFAVQADPASVSVFEAKLFTPFTPILTNDVVELQPYVFQILSMMLLSHSDGVPAPYAGLFPFLLRPEIWASSANSTPLVDLLQAYISVGGQAIVADASQLEGLLGIFQKLVSNKSQDQHGFRLLSTVVQYIPLDKMQRYMPNVFSLCLTRLQKSKT